MADKSLLPIGGVDHLVYLAVGKEDEFGGIVADRVIFHPVDQVHQHPDGSQQAPVHVLALGFVGAVEAVTAVKDPPLPDEVGQEHFDLRLFPGVQAEKLFLRQRPVHGNVPQDAGGLLVIDLCSCFYGKTSLRAAAASIVAAALCVIAPYYGRIGGGALRIGGVMRAYCSANPYKRHKSGVLTCPVAFLLL